VFGHLFHGPFDYLITQLAGPGLIVAAPKEKGIDAPVISFVDELLQLINFFWFQNSANLLLQVF
jgi:hypothetical protein